MLHIEPIKPTEFASIRREWNDILAASGSDNIHLRHEWLLSWTETVGTSRELLPLRIKDGKTTIGFAPLVLNSIRLKGVLPYKQILFLGEPESDFADFILTRDREKALAAVFTHLSREVGWGEILLHNLSEKSPNLPALRTTLQTLGLKHEFTVSTPCYFIPMRGRTWEDYLQSDVNPKFVSGIGGVQKRYTYYKRVKWDIQELSDGKLDDALYERLAHLHECSQRRKERGSMYREKLFRHFLERVAAELGSQGWFSLILLTVDSRPASYVIGFQHNRVYYHWNIGFDLDFEKMAPSKFLLWHILKDGFEQQKWDEFNFMRGATDYKLHWTQRFYNLLQVRILNTKGAYGALNLLRRPTRKEAAPDNP